MSSFQELAVAILVEPIITADAVCLRIVQCLELIQIA